MFPLHMQPGAGCGVGFATTSPHLCAHSPSVVKEEHPLQILTLTWVSRALISDRCVNIGWICIDVASRPRDRSSDGFPNILKHKNCSLLLALLQKFSHGVIWNTPHHDVCGCGMLLWTCLGTSKWRYFGRTSYEMAQCWILYV